MPTGTLHTDNKMNFKFQGPVALLYLTMSVTFCLGSELSVPVLNICSLTKSLAQFS